MVHIATKLRRAIITFLALVLAACGGDVSGSDDDGRGGGPGEGVACMDADEGDPCATVGESCEWDSFEIQCRAACQVEGWNVRCTCYDENLQPYPCDG